MRFDLLMAAAILLASVIPMVASAGENSEALPITGGFVQLDNSLVSWSPERWEQELDAMQAAGINLIIVQYSGGDRRRFYPVDQDPDVFQIILDAAAKRQMSVWAGLSLDSDWWNNSVDFEQTAATAVRTADEIWRAYGGHTALTGWYIPHEIDDLRFRSPELMQKMAGFLRTISDRCSQLSGDLPVSIAPFFGKNMAPGYFETWWTGVLETAGVDVVMLQDGVGCHRVDLDVDVPRYYAALQRACQKTGVQFWSDLEVFNQTHGWPVDGKSWSAEPADFSRVKKQLEVESRYVNRIVIFDFPHYMSPHLGGQAKALYEAYTDWLK